MSDDFENMVLRIVDRYMAGRHSKRYGVVSSWDADKHLSKIRIQPEDVETGWIPTHTMSAGDGYGHMTALGPGDHVEVTHQEGEFEGGAVTARVHSKKDPPPKLESYEQLFKAQFGQFIKLAKDGSITLKDKSGNASIFLDGQGNITLKASKITHDVTGEHKITGQPVSING